ncbi:DUF2637 domain-containing protein [Streptomyces nojiriensis]|uniref:DUF2637 domain-containing protein n=1 Tax=Streptomyces nojiriensis TaxID=66374 RepID=UPI0036D7A739
MTATGPAAGSPKSTETAERFTLAAAGAVIAALTAAAFWLSYAHLAEVAGQHGLAKSPERQWAWPGTLDAFIVVGELLMLRAGLRRVTDWWAVALTAIGSVGSIVLNVAGVNGTGSDPVPLLDYVVAAVPPTAALLAFGVLMRQIHQHVAAPVPAPAEEVPLPTDGTSGDRVIGRATPGDGASPHSRDGDGTAVPAGGDQPVGDRPPGDWTSAVPEKSHGPRPVPDPAVPTGTETEKAMGTVPDLGTGDRHSGDRPEGDRVATVPKPEPGPHMVPVPRGDRPEGTDCGQDGDGPGTVPHAGTGHGPRTVPNSVPKTRAASGDRPGHAPATVRSNRISGDRPSHDRTSTVPGTETEEPRPHPVPGGDQDNAGDRDGDRGSADAEDAPANRRRGPVPKSKRPGDRVPERPRTGRGPGSRPRLTEDEIVDLLRPHVRTALERDGNEAVTRVQLRAIMRDQRVPIRNDRLTPVLARLRTDSTKTRSHAR